MPPNNQLYKWTAKSEDDQQKILYRYLETLDKCRVSQSTEETELQAVQTTRLPAEYQKLSLTMASDSLRILFDLWKDRLFDRDKNS